MATPLAYSVGLGGDGDEIEAIKDVERAFSVTLDKAGAGDWVTAGHVYAALCDALPPDAPSDGRWDRFAAALSQETGVDPKLLTVDSPLIGGGVPIPWWVIPAAIVIGFGYAVAFK